MISFNRFLLHQPPLKAHNQSILANFFKYHFYDLKITFGYTGVIPKNFMSKCTHSV